MKGYNETGWLTSFEVDRTVEEAYQKSIFSAPAGLIECSEDQKCVCLTGNTTNGVPATIRGNPETGKPDNEGKICLVKTGEPCITRYFKSGVKRKVEFPCLNYDICIKLNHQSSSICKANHATSDYNFQEQLIVYFVLFQVMKLLIS